MIPIGNRPILWHVMKYYAHFGFTDFVLCLGYKAEAIKHFFLTYNEAMSNDFVLSSGGADVHLLKTDIHDWNITFVDTGLHARSASGCGRCATSSATTSVPRQLRRHAHRRGPSGDDRAGEGLGRDGQLPRGAPELQLPRRLGGRRRAWSASISDVTKSDIWINGGYFVLRSEFFDQIGPGEDLVEEPFQRLIERGELLAQRHEGFWAPMDTLKDKQWLETLARERRGPVGALEHGPRGARPGARWPPPGDGPAVDRSPGGGAVARARDRRPPRRHRDRLRRHVLKLIENEALSPRSAGSC